MNTLSKCGVRFYLTGGTALSRGYYNHRYSDDLDFFVNQDVDYQSQIKEVFYKLKENGFIWDTDVDFNAAEAYTSFNVKWDQSDTLLKLDFVNDSTEHVGEIIETSVYYRTDSIQNLISNKLSAIFRFAAKDVADIREIALRESVDWAQAISDARNKDAGVELHYVAQILTGMPQSEFEKIAWVRKTPWDEFRADIEKIAFDMLNG